MDGRWTVPARAASLATLLKATLAGVLSALAFSSIAQAEQASFPGDRPARNAMLEELVTMGEGFWHARDVQPCPVDQLDVRLADELGDDDAHTGAATGRSDMACTVWFRESIVAAAQRGGWESWNAKQALCHVAFHELGHSGGLQHTETGVMHDDGLETDADVPAECRAWATAAAQPRRNAGRAGARALARRRRPRAR